MKFKRLLLFVAKFLVAIAILWFLLRSAQLKPQLFTSLLLQPILTMGVVAILLSMVFVGAWRWRVLNVSQGIHLSYFETFSATYIGAAFNYVLPGSVGGDMMRMYYVVDKNPLKKGSAVLTVFYDRVMGFVAVIMTICLFSLLSLDSLRQSPQLFYLLTLCTLFCCSVLAMISLFIFLPEKIGVGAWLSRRFPENKWINYAVSFLNTLNKFRMTKSVILKCLMISIINQLMIVSCVFIIAKIMGLPSIAFIDYALAMSISQIVNLIPLTPGGVGIGEMAFANILQLLNPGIVGAFATIFFTYRVLSILTYTPGILIYISKILFLKQRNKFKRTATVG